MPEAEAAEQASEHFIKHSYVSCCIDFNTHIYRPHNSVVIVIFVENRIKCLNVSTTQKITMSYSAPITVPQNCH